MTEMRNQFAKVAYARWWLGPVTGAIVSTTITGIVVTWEWIENPGGIFRGDLGTNWLFVSDTAISWFVPVFFYVAAIVSILQLVWHLVKKYRGGMK